MKKIILAVFALFFSASFTFSQKVTFLDDASFKANVWNYEKNPNWKFIGDKPMIIDFYADWCRPCKMIAPHLNAIQSEYGDKLQVYKINTDKNPGLANLFKVRSIPTLLFIPADGNYKQEIGYKDKQQFEELISTVLKVEK